MMRHSLLVITALLVSSLAYAAPTPARVDRADSKLSFEAFTTLFDADGTFNDWKVSGKVDPESFENSQVTVTIDAASIDTDNSSRDEHLRNSDFFHVERYPTIKFVTSSIKARSAGAYTVTGNLTIKETTRALAIPVAVERRGDQLSVRGVLNLDRYDYGIDYESGMFEPTIKRQVNIRLDLLFDLPK
jgi:polyisoprenoid-binding protein YceI